MLPITCYEMRPTTRQESIAGYRIVGGQSVGISGLCDRSRQVIIAPLRVRVGSIASIWHPIGVRLSLNFGHIGPLSRSTRCAISGHPALITRSLRRRARVAAIKSRPCRDMARGSTRLTGHNRPLRYLRCADAGCALARPWGAAPYALILRSRSSRSIASHLGSGIGSSTLSA